MPKKRRHEVYRYFDVDQTSNSSTCLIEGCQKKLKSTHCGNLLSHIKSKHPVNYEVVDSINKENVEPNRGRRRSDRFNYLKQQCVNLVTVKGRSFTLMDDEPFQNIINMIPLEERGTINSRNIKTAIKEKAENIVDDLSRILKNRLICLKVDSATCADRGFLGINVQYVNEGKIHLCTLGVVELTKSHTSDFLADVVKRTLMKFYLNTGQIYSITTDNGSNMIKMTKLLSHMNYTEGPDDTVNTGDEDDAESDADNEVDDFERTITLMAAPIDSDERFTVTSMRCAAHTLQLAVLDALKDSQTQKLLDEARSIVRQLRRQNSRLWLQQNNMKNAIIDCVTRWSSVANMLERLLELKPACVAIKNVNNVDEHNWEAWDEMLKALCPARILTNVLQSEQLSIGDFYCGWMRCKIETGKVGTPLALILKKNMTDREEKLHESNGYLAAMYMDPRVNSTLSLEQQEMAREHLLATWKRMNHLEYSGRASLPDRNDPVPGTSTSDRQSDEIEEILKMAYAQKHVSATNNANSFHADDVRVLEMLRSFLNEPLVSPNENVYKYWEKMKISNPQLYKLAQVALALPATQVSVERLFSSLKFVLSKLRTRLNDSSVEDVLLIRNYEHLK